MVQLPPPTCHPVCVHVSPVLYLAGVQMCYPITAFWRCFVSPPCCVCTCVSPGAGALQGCAWEAAATPPLPGNAGDTRGGWWEDKDGGREGGSAPKKIGITTEITARQAVGGNFSPTLIRGKVLWRPLIGYLHRFMVDFPGSEKRATCPTEGPQCFYGPPHRIHKTRGRAISQWPGVV